MTSAAISPPSTTTPRQAWIVWGIAAATLALHLAFGGRYELMRNELYFLVCGWRPDFGYVDQPALVPLIAAATQSFGINAWAMRLPGAFAGALLVPLSATFARELGGSMLSGWLAAAAVALSAPLIALTGLLTTSTFEPLAWTAIAYLVSRAAVRDDRRALILAGLIAGVAMEAKWALPIWLAGLAAGLIATPERRLLALKEIWIGVALAALIAAPGAIWQAAHGWPFLEVTARHNPAGSDFNGGPLRFLISQLIAINPVLALLALAGIIAPFAALWLKAARFLAVAYVISFVIVFAAHGKDYYLFPAYPTLFAVGAAACRKLPRLVAAAGFAVALALAAIVAPLALPILDPPDLARYMEKLHLHPRPDEAAAIGAPLTQAFSDEFGWRELASRVATTWRALPEADRAHAAILARNYGEAAAIDVYGAADGLPPALSGQNQYFQWGPRGFNGNVILHVGGDPERWRKFCASVDIVGTFGAPYTMPYENERPIFVCRGPKVPLDQAWPRFRDFH